MKEVRKIVTGTARRRSPWTGTSSTRGRARMVPVCASSVGFGDSKCALYGWVDYRNGNSYTCYAGCEAPAFTGSTPSSASNTHGRELEPRMHRAKAEKGRSPGRTMDCRDCSRRRRHEAPGLCAPVRGAATRPRTDGAVRACGSRSTTTRRGSVGLATCAGSGCRCLLDRAIACNGGVSVPTGRVHLRDDCQSLGTSCVDSLPHLRWRHW